MRNSSLVARYARHAAAIGLLLSALSASPASALTSLSTTGIVVDNFTANGNVNMDDASADTIVIGQNGGTPDTVTIAGIGNLNLTNTGNNLTLASGGLSANGNITLTDSQWSISNTGVAAFASVNGLTLTSNADGFSLAGGTTPRTLTVTGGTVTLNSTGAGSNLTLPGTGTLATLAGNETLTNKTIDKASNTLTGVASSGTNSDITSLTGLSTPLSVGQGGTGGTSFTVGALIKGNGTSAFGTVAAPTGTIVGTSDAQTLTNKTLTGATLSLDDTGSSFNLLVVPTSSPSLTADRQLTFNVNNANRIITLTGDLSTAGTGPITFTSAGVTNLTLPTTGTVTALGNSTTGTGTTIVLGTAPTLSLPRIGTINDTNGVAALTFNPTASAVNAFTMLSGATGVSPTLSVTGTDANIDMKLQAKGTGGHVFLTTATNSDIIRLQPFAAGASTFIGTLTSSDLTGNQTWTLPATGGTIALTSDITNVSGWTDGGATVSTITATDNAVIGGSTAGGKLQVETTGSPTVKGLIVKGDASQTASLQEWFRGSTLVAKLDNFGNFIADGNGGTYTMNTAATTTVDLFNTVATTMNIGGAATTMNIGANGGSMLLRSNVTTGGTITAGSTLNANGVSLILDADNATAAANVSIIANQGASLDGVLRYNATSTKWETSSDGGTTFTDLASSGLTGTGAAGGVAFWTNPSTLSNDASFFWDNTNKRLGLGTNAPASALTVVASSALTANTIAGLQLDAMTTGVPAAGFGAGIIFRAEDTNATADLVASIDAVYTDALHTSEDTELRFFTRSAGGGLTNALTIGNTGNLTTSGSLVIGTGSAPIARHFSVTQVVVAPAIPADSCALYGTVNIAGALPGDSVVATPTATGSGIEESALSWNSYVASSNQVAIRACNPTSGVIDVGDTQVWRVDVWKH